MALQQPIDPLEQLRKNQPRFGAVQNTGGRTPNTAPLANRPVPTPGVNTGTIGRPPGPIAQPPALSPGTAPAFSPPAPVPAPPAPAPAAPVAAPATGGTDPKPPSLYGSGGGGSPSLEDQLRAYITGSLGGGTSQEFLNSAKNQLGSAVEGQRAQNVNRINDDAISRGIFRSGIPAEMTQAAGASAQGAFARGLADILSGAEDRNAQVRAGGAAMGQSLLGMNREQDIYNQQRADQQAARSAASAAAAREAEGETFTYVDPDTGESYEMNTNWF